MATFSSNVMLLVSFGFGRIGATALMGRGGRGGRCCGLQEHSERNRHCLPLDDLAELQDRDLLFNLLIP